MSPRLLDTGRACITLALFTLNVLFWFVPIFLIAILKLLVPVAAWHDLTGRWLIACGETWISCNQGILALTQRIQWDIRGTDGLARREWYLVVANHQTWVDILVLQGVFNRRIPFLKFFIKQELVWMPFLGLAWWAMDMPFMKRYSREYLERHPEKRGRDLEATRKACEKFRRIPTSVINFIEGTRLTPDKLAHSGAGYRHLLPPKAGGIAFVIGAMGDTLHRLLDVTIVYPDGAPSMWALCSGKVRRIVVMVTQRDIDEWILRGDYAADPEFRIRLQRWVTGMWQEKDAHIAALLAGHRRGTPAR
jgi:1-acyl-sn-glycerol-3-phosphate acyltransferase